MKTLLFAFTAFFAVVLIISLFLLFQSMQSKSVNPTNPTVTAPTPIEAPSSKFNKPQVPYNGTKTDQLIDSMKNRKTLSDAGAAAKEKLKTSLQGKSGTLYESSQVLLEYVSSPDLFQAQIKTINISSAKQEAVNWLMSQGFTSSDMCVLPLSFYLLQSLKPQLSQMGTVFNPLPEGC
ncbi:MAG: hypothetical protein ACM3IJ_01900 [Candidatus Levyibacteriota bacterium]